MNAFERFILREAWMIAYRNRKWRLHNMLKSLYNEGAEDGHKANEETTFTVQTPNHRFSEGEKVAILCCLVICAVVICLLIKSGAWFRYAIAA